MFLETICIQHGIALHLETHRARMQRTAEHFGFRAPALPNLQQLIPSDLFSEKVRCSIVYKAKIEEITFKKYVPKTITSLKIVEAVAIDYAFKFANRKVLQQFLHQKSACDEILITQHGCITDTSYSNVVFKRGETYFTPDTYLLNGTKRQQLLSEGKIKETRITVDNFTDFESVHLINAMLDIEDDISTLTSKIHL